MPEQPNHCTSCGKLMPDTNAAYYCSKACMDKVRAESPAERADRIGHKFIEARRKELDRKASCLLCGQIGERAIWYEDSGVYVCMECRELNRKARANQVAEEAAKLADQHEAQGIMDNRAEYAQASREIAAAIRALPREEHG